MTNLQGDVTEILDANGTAVVSYTYDAWGNPLSTAGTMSAILGTLNPLRYRGYVYDHETGLYYLQSRYYNPTTGRFINADIFTSTGQGQLGNNVFAYCLNNPVNLNDPTGEIAITTLVLIGSIIVGVGAATYTACVEYNAGCDTTQIVLDSIVAGLSAFTVVYSCGMTAYSCYQNYCYLNGLTPVTNIGGSVQKDLQNCANAANAHVQGTGPAAGTKKHTYFASQVNALRNTNLRTEVSYLNGREVSYGTKGSVRFDVMMFDGNIPVQAWDFKTGAAILTSDRIMHMQQVSGLNISISMIK